MCRGVGEICGGSDVGERVVLRWYRVGWEGVRRVCGGEESERGKGGRESV